MIGKYKTAIYLKSGDDHILDEEPDLLIICNPWCEKDQTYLENEEARQEYVLNDTGYIWRGTKKCLKIFLLLFKILITKN